MQTRSRGLFFVVGILIILISGQIVAYSTFFHRAKDDSKIINESGKIRGASQRLTKLELFNGENLELRQYVDDLITLHTIQKSFTTKNKERAERLNNLKVKWEELTLALDQYHQNPTDQNQKKVIEQSEALWEVSNNFVTDNQSINERTVSYFKYFTVSLSLNIVAIIFILIILKIYIYNELEISAIYDPLTKVFNRRYFNVYMENEILRAKRSNKLFCLIMLDIDNFKHINDTYGHITGDYVLETLVKIVKENIRKHDVISRIGGEEFTIILPDTEVKGAFCLAERIRKSVEEYAFDYGIKITVSLGISQFRIEDDNQAMLERADTALYKAKNSGKNRTEIDKYLTIRI